MKSTANKDYNHLSLRVNDKETELLTSIAMENSLYKRDGTPSLSMAIKQLIKDNMNQGSQQNNNIKIMIEQINALIPQLIFNTLFSTKVNSTAIKNEVFNQIYSDTIKSVSRICGQLQENKYEEVYPAKDKKNMTILPIEEYKNTWK